MDLYAKIVLFFQHGGEFMYPIALVMAIGRRDLARAVFLPRAPNSGEPSRLRENSAAAAPAAHARGSGARVEVEVCGVRDCRRRHRALESHAAPPGHRVRDGRAIARSVAAYRASHALSGDVCKRFDAARPAGDGHWTDRCVHGGRVGGSGRESGAAVEEHLGIDELHGVRFDGRDSAAAAAFDAAEQDERNRRKPRDRVGQVPQSDGRPTGTCSAESGGAGAIKRSGGSSQGGDEPRLHRRLHATAKA